MWLAFFSFFFWVLNARRLAFFSFLYLIDNFSTRSHLHTTNHSNSPLTISFFFWREIWKRWWSEQIIDLFRDFGELINSTRSDPVRDEWSQVRFSLSCSRYLLFALGFLFTFIFQMVYVKYVKYLCNDRVWEQFVEKKQNNLKSSSTNEKGNIVFNRESKAKREKKHLVLLCFIFSFSFLSFLLIEEMHVRNHFQRCSHEIENFKQVLFAC